MSEECTCGVTQESRDTCPYTIAWRAYVAACAQQEESED